MATREELVYRAKLAEQAERYDDMVSCMKEVINIGGDKVVLTVEERNLLSVAFKNVIGARRASWRITSSIQSKSQTQAPEGSNKQALAKEFQTTIESELSSTCADIIGLLDDKLIPGVKDDTDYEAIVFYYKMKGDYHRYEAEFKSDKENAKESSLKAYGAANDLAMNQLESTHPIRLGLALNFSVFYYEICNSSSKACELAKKAFDDAITELDQLNEDSYKDSTLIMQLLRDNLTLWATDHEANERDDEEQQEAN